MNVYLYSFVFGAYFQFICKKCGKRTFISLKLKLLEKELQTFYHLIKSLSVVRPKHIDL